MVSDSLSEGHLHVSECPLPSSDVTGCLFRLTIVVILVVFYPSFIMLHHPRTFSADFLTSLFFAVLPVTEQTVNFCSVDNENSSQEQCDNIRKKTRCMRQSCAAICLVPLLYFGQITQVCFWHLPNGTFEMPSVVYHW